VEKKKQSINPMVGYTNESQNPGMIRKPNVNAPRIFTNYGLTNNWLKKNFIPVHLQPALIYKIKLSIYSNPLGFATLTCFTNLLLIR
jgi:hypothetical protein